MTTPADDGPPSTDQFGFDREGAENIVANSLMEAKSSVDENIQPARRELVDVEAPAGANPVRMVAVKDRTGTSPATRAPAAAKPIQPPAPQEAQPPQNTQEGKLNLQRIPLERIDSLVADGLARKVKDPNGSGEVVVLPMVTPDGGISTLILARHQDIETFGATMGASSRPVGDPYYAVVRSLRIDAKNVPDPEVLKGAIVSQLERAAQIASTHYFEQGDIATKQFIAGTLTFVLHFTPVGAAADYASQGEWREATISFAGDLAMFFTAGLSKVATTTRAGIAVTRAAKVAGVGIEGSIALYRFGESGYYFHHEEYGRGAGCLGEAFLRLIGMPKKEAGQLVARLVKRKAAAGRWQSVNEAMSARARAYQAQITGRTGEAYVVNGVKFDGFNAGTLLDAKGLGYTAFVRNGQFQPWFQGRQALLDQAKKQVRAAGGTPIKWHVAEADAATAMRNLLQQNNITGITIVHTPVIP